MRILQDAPTSIAKAWCWRDGWATGFDSAFGLLQKFALLNALTAKEIATLFLNRTSGRRTAVLRNVNVDLRDATLFDVTLIADTLRIQISTVRDAFLYQQFPMPAQSVSHLKWCPLCMGWGLHLPCTQMQMITTCPIHDVQLVQRCEACDGELPYFLSAEVFATPFSCPRCGLQLAQCLRRSPSRVPTLTVAETTRIGLMQRQLQMYSQMARPTIPVPTYHGEIVLSQPRVALSESQAYLTFIGQAACELGVSQQLHLGLSPLARAECGHRGSDPNAEPTETVDAAREARFDTAAEIHIAKDVYRAIRRRLRRHLVAAHRKCLHDACSHLWWDMRAAVTVPICPVAAAFIRWRMTWEGCGTPRYLDAPRNMEYFGILAWLYSRPAPYPQSWSPQRKAWMLAHIFRAACLASFEAVVRSVNSDTAGATLRWRGEEGNPALETTYWAMNSDQAEGATPVLMTRRSHIEPLAQTSAAERHAHQDWHRSQLRQIVR